MNYLKNSNQFSSIRPEKINKKYLYINNKSSLAIPNCLAANLFLIIRLASPRRLAGFLFKCFFTFYFSL